MSQKKIMHVLIALISIKVLLKPTKTRHHWTPQPIKSTKIFCLSFCLTRQKLQALIYDAVETKWFSMISFFFLFSYSHGKSSISQKAVLQLSPEQDTQCI